MKLKYVFLFTLISLFTHAQTYVESWKKVNNLENQAEYREAFKMISSIEKKAKKEDNEIQKIKTFLFKSKYNNVWVENAEQIFFTSINKEIKKAKAPYANWLNYIAAKTLLDYFNQNRYKISNKSNSSLKNNWDLKAWDKNKFYNEIGNYLENSISNPEIVKNIYLKDYEELIDFGDEYLINNERNLLDFFASNYNSFYVPNKKLTSVEIFNLIKNSYPENAFWRENLKSQSILDSVFKIKNSIDALTYSISSSKKIYNPYIQEKIKLKTLTHIFKQENDNSKTKFLPELAQHFSDITQSSNLKIKETAISYVNEIKSFNAVLNFPYNCVSNQEFIGVLQSKNANVVYIDIYKSKELNNLVINDSILKKFKPYKSFERVIKNNNLHTYTKKEIVFPALPVGEYTIVVRNEKLYELNKTFGVSQLNISDLHLISFKDRDHYKFQILDGKKGSINKEAKFICNGIEIKPKDDFYTVDYDETLEIVATYKTDTLKKSIYFYKYDNDTKDKVSQKIQLYTDRDLYEPGEKVQFKLIAIQQNKDIVEVLENEKLTVYLINASSKKMDSLTVTTNMFGSSSGEFLLPKNGMNGKFSLKTNYKNQQFYKNIRVEEFKIPTFEIKIDPITKSILPTDKTITITGTAIAFAGNPIQNATGSVNFELLNDDDEEEDEDDEEDEVDDETTVEATTYNDKQKSKNKIGLTTDNEGKFTISLPVKFNKISDDEFNRWYKPEVITYNLNFEILDTDGEKQSKKFSFKTSPKLFYTETNATISSQNHEMEILLSSKDINNINIPTKVVVDIYEIKSNVENKISNTAQTQNIEDRVSLQEFQTIYPELEYESEINQSKWNVITKSKQITKECKGETIIKEEELKNLKQGWYKIVAAYSKEMVTLYDTVYVFKSNQNQQNVLKSFLDINLIKQNNKLALNYNSAFQAFNLHQIIYVDNTIIQSKNVILTKGLNTETINLEIKPEQKVEVFTYGVLNNNVINKRTSYTEPKKANKTEIKIETFRDKLIPNSQEQWKLKINTDLNNKNFEVLAALHNIALDKIYASNNFNYNLKNYYTNYTYKNINLDNNLNRYSRYYNGYGSYQSNIKPFKTNQDQFNWYNFNINTYTFPNIKWKNEFKNPVKNNVNEFTIKGVVFDNQKNALPGVSITVKGSTKGTITDLDGKFELKVIKQDQLTFAYLGFNTQEFLVKPYSEYIIYLEDSENSLEEVVVTGYKSKNTNDQVKYTIPEITTADKDSGYIKTLEGKVSGLNITSGSGQPGGSTNAIKGKSSINTNTTKYIVDGVSTTQAEIQNLREEDIYYLEIIDDTIVITTKKTQQKLANIKARETKEYTGFFFPHITTNAKGEFNLNFTAPQSSAAWKLRLLAHNKQAESTSISKEIITQKQFMVQPNWPTFIKETDKITIKSKIINLENTITRGKTQIQIIDPKTQKDITNLFNVNNQIQDFSIQPNQDLITTWQITVPNTFNHVILKIVAFNDSAQDGEQINIPVVSNTQIIEKATPIWINPTEKFEKNVDANPNQTTKISITNNVNALILQAIPYIVKGKTTTSTELFNKIYAQIIGNHIISNNQELKDKIKQITSQTRATIKQNNSNEIENTPWNLEANTHQYQLENLATYLHPDEIENQIISDLQELKSYKLTNGFPWLKYGIPNHEITFDILSGLGEAQAYTNNSKISKEIQELAEQIFNEIDKEVQQSLNKKESTYVINTNSYIYARSFYKNLNTSKEIKKYIEKYVKSNQNTTNYNQKAKLSILYFNNNQKDKAQKLLKQIKAAAVIDQTKGMYFKTIANTQTQNQIETQANIIKAFKMVTNDDKTVQSLTNWLIYNKQANHWKNQHQTTLAISALASKNLINNSEYTVKINNKTLKPNPDFYQTIEANVNPEDNITINNKSNTTIFGGIYTQQKLQIQNITPSNNPEIQITKQYFINQNNKIKESNKFNLGDVITIKLTITTQQNQNFIVVTNNRISAAFPEEQLSKNHSKYGLNYYQTNNATNTKFYITNLPKGTHVIEYNLKATHNGQINTGITTIESMYAPQIKANTNSIEINIKN